MKNVLRTLIYGGQVSLTLADTTELVKEGARLHTLSPASAYIFGKALSAMTYMSACLKNENGEISLSLQCDGACGDIAVSGNSALRMRGYISNTALQDKEKESDCFGTKGTLAVIRDDGYRRPFVGSCALPKDGDLDEAFEEYYRVSEQLPTRIATAIEQDESGNVIFAGVAVIQPLPFAEDTVLEKVNALDMRKLLSDIRSVGIEQTALTHFEISREAWELREATYQCNCSREYLTRVLVSLGEEELRTIIKEDGAVRVHCHYCNTDYEFTQEDADKLFPRR